MYNNQYIMKDRIIDIVEETLGISEEKVLPCQKIKEINIDSLDMFEIIMKIEEISGMDIDAEQIAKFETINDIIQYFERKNEEEIKEK